MVADCAHGAAYRIAPEVLRRAGADVIVIGAEPDGLNINAGCGSTSLGALTAAVVELGADAGIAYDGDADRCLAVDADGQPLDGDQILTVLATELKEEGRLAGDAVVVTVMSNQGFHVAMRDAGIKVIETPVGDKHVSAAMREGGYLLGGEQSGHIIMGEHASTGDGVLTSLQLLAAVNRRGVTLAAAAKMMPKYPQVLVNVPGDASRLGPAVAAAVARAEAELGGDGRILVRPSGTEPTIRLMIQAKDAVLAERVIGRLADEVRLALRGRNGMRDAYEVAAVRAAERALMELVPDGTLMGRAATGLAAVCASLLRQHPGQVYGTRVVVLAGSGDNGGDALYAGAWLARRGAAVTAVAAGSRAHPGGAEALRRAGGRIDRRRDRRATGPSPT